MKKPFLFLSLLLCIMACSKSDPCADTKCQNGGTCIGGACDCPPGYTGTLCQSEKTPSSVLIQKIRIKSFPPTDINGAGWDVFDGPDIRLIILDANGNQLYKSASYFENATAGQSITFSPAVVVTTPSNPITIQAWDDDSGFGDDYMGGILAAMYQPGLKFPETINLSCAGCTISVDVDLVYFF